MRPFISFVLLVALATALCGFQRGVQVIISPAPVAVAGSWTFVASSSGQSGRALNVSCASAVCTLTIPSSGSGNGAILLVMDNSGSGITLSTVTGACASWVIDASAHISSGAIGDNNGAYCLSTSSGATSVVATLSTTASQVDMFYFEASWSGSSISKDTEGSASRTTNTSIAGVTLTLGGGTDLIGQMIQLGGGSPVTAVSSPYDTNFLNADGVTNYSFVAASVAITASGAGPTWTPTSTAASIVNAIALKGN